MRGLLARLALALLAVVAAAPAAGAAPVVSLQDDALVNARGPELEARLDALAATGIRVTRVDVLWREVAPRRPADARDPDDPAYDWSLYDAIVRGLSARGIGVLLDFYRTPAWASARGTPNAAPRRSGRRYSGSHPDPAGGTLPAVRRLEIWNEPNLPGFWTPQCRRRRGRAVPVSPRAYAALLAAAYREVKRASPATIVVGGVVGPAGRTPRACPRGGAAGIGSLDFTARVARERPPIDAWSQHLYPIGSPLGAVFSPSWSTLSRAYPHVDKLRRGAPVYVTETGYHTSYNRFHRYFVSEAQQALWVDETFAAAARDPRVELVTWFNFQDNPLWTGGLLRADGSRKPSYDRFAAQAAATPPPAGWAP